MAQLIATEQIDQKDQEDQKDLEFYLVPSYITHTGLSDVLLGT